jgi:hypothetical protein
MVPAAQRYQFVKGLLTGGGIALLCVVLLITLWEWLWHPPCRTIVAAKALEEISDKAVREPLIAVTVYKGGVLRRTTEIDSRFLPVVTEALVSMNSASVEVGKPVIDTEVVLVFGSESDRTERVIGVLSSTSEVAPVLAYLELKCTFSESWWLGPFLAGR